MNIEHWKQFESTGRIEDYLHFLSCERQEKTGREEDSRPGYPTAGLDRKQGKRTGNDGHAGIYMGDRDHTKADSGGGVRQAYQSFDERAR